MQVVAAMHESIADNTTKPVSPRSWPGVLRQCLRVRAWRTRQLPGDRYFGRRRVLAVLAWWMVVLLAVEVMLQARSQILTGQSALSRLVNGSQVVTDEATGLRLLRPGSVVRGTRGEVRANSLGLRSPEIPALKMPGEYRIAIIGASSVMGVHAPSNEHTLSAYLEARLRSGLGSQMVNVVNAGIYGATLHEETLMLKYVTDRLRPDLVLLYTGFNDFAPYCSDRPSAARQREAFSLPMLELPAWVQTVDLLLKNTTSLRPAAGAGQGMRDPRALDLKPYRKKLDRLLEFANGTGAQVMLATNTRSYRPEQPLAVQEKLAQSARSFYPCFDVTGLNHLYRQHTDVMRAVAGERGVPLIRLDEMIPGGPQYFDDSTHFNDRGNQLTASLLAKAIAAAGYPGKPGIAP